MHQPRRAVRIGLIGAGKWGRNFIRTISQVKDLELAWVASSNPETAGLVGPDCRVTRDWHDLCRASDLDGVIIATPPALHAEMTLEALSRGHHVLVEKPLALTVADAEAVCTLAQSAGKTVLVDHIRLYHPAYRKLKTLLGSPERIRAVRCVNGRWGPFRQNVPVLWDWGPHEVAVCLDLMGHPPIGTAAERRTAGPGGPPGGEELSLRLDYPGARCDIVVGNVFPERRRCVEVTTETEVLIFDDQGEEKLHVRRRTDPDAADRVISITWKWPLVVLLETFRDLVRVGNLENDSLDLGASVVRVLSKLDEMLGSAEENR